MSESKFDKVKYNNEFNAKAYDRINLVVPKGKKEQIKEYAENIGMSTNAFIVKAIEDAMTD